MSMPQRNVLGSPLTGRIFGRAGILTVLVLAVMIYFGIQLAVPNAINGPDIDLRPSALPTYALLSLLRMTASYLLSLTFAFIFGYTAARNRTAERIMLPILDVLQSVPLLSFLPVVLLFLTTLIPGRMGIECSAVVLIFTSQAWNIAYSFHQSVRTAPRELQEASDSFRLNWWYRLRHLELPFGMQGLLWNSMVSWANGWFFLMAAETFRVNNRDFRLPGLGSYLQRAAETGDTQATILGFATLVIIVVLLDQILWQPLLAWAEKFRADLVESEEPRQSWFLEIFKNSWLASLFLNIFILPVINLLDRRFGGPLSYSSLDVGTHKKWTLGRVIRMAFMVIILAVIAYGAFQVIRQLIALPLDKWGQILTATGYSSLRILVASSLCLLWTVPVGVWIGTNPRLSAILGPIVQSIAAVPATAFFPLLVVYMVRLPFGLDGAAILLMMLGTQWYLLFNVIAGASAIPQELKDVVNLFSIRGWTRWRTLILPVLLPYIITGLNIVGGGAWNASIVAEYTEYRNNVYQVPGLGSIISQSTATADYGMLLAATLTMIVTVVLVNSFVWQRLHHVAEERYRLE